jgi:hypothetical protein
MSSVGSRVCCGGLYVGRLCQQRRFLQQRCPQYWPTPRISPASAAFSARGSSDEPSIRGFMRASNADLNPSPGQSVVLRIRRVAR